MTLVPFDQDRETAAAAVCAALAHCRFRYENEEQLQRSIHAVLAKAGIEAEREARLTSGDRVDLLVDRVGIEVKIAGAPGAVTRQLDRYARSGKVDALVLVTNRSQHRSIPRILTGGVRLSVVVISSV